MTILDSNVWIAYFNKNDSLHEKAVKIFSTVKNIAITEYIVAETATVILNKADRKTANKFLEIILDNSDITILHSDKRFFEETARTFTEIISGKLSFIDISLLFLSKKYKIITFDEKLEKIIKKSNYSNLTKAKTK